MTKELWKPLEWTVNSKGEPMAMCPSHYYTIVKDGEKYTVRRIRYQDSHKDDCTGFASIYNAKKFAQDDYETKMAKWLSSDWSKRAVTPYVREVFADWARTDPLTDTVNWFKVAKPEPTNADKTTQIGCNLEEVGEMIEALCGSEWGELISLANACKNAEEDESLSFLNDSNKLELLDSLADQIVTAVGVAYMFGFDIIGALKEVNASNWSKFENGKAVTDENGKIIKGSGYFKPELDKFVGGQNE